MIKQSVIAAIAAFILAAGVSLAQAETSGQADVHSSNANAGAASTPMAHSDQMMHKHMTMKKKMRHKAM